MRYTLYRGIWRTLLHDPLETSLLATAPMGLSTLITFSALSFPSYHRTIWSLWLFDTITAVGMAIVIPFLMITRQKISLERFSSVLLQPSVAPVIAAACGSVVAGIVPLTEARITVGLWSVPPFPLLYFDQN